MAKKRHRQPSVHVISLGCAKNLVDTEIMLGALAQAGYAISGAAEGADVVLMNTCGFVREAEAEAQEEISRLAELRRQNRIGRLVVAGCLAQRRKQALRDKFPEIDILVGTSGVPDIAELLKTKTAEFFPEKTALPDHTYARLPATPPWTAYLRTAEGCSNRCAYCIIPMLRGDFRSRTPDSLEREARDLVDMGVDELVLIAQDNTRYGRDLDPPSNLPALLQRLDTVPDLYWLRVMYCHPARVDRELIETIAACEKVLPYIDMPVQHAHPDILGAMNRPGSPEKMLETIQEIRNIMPDACIRTTAMVGFPGETDVHFQALLDFVREARFDRLGAFRYSPEPEAPAAFMPEQVSESAKGDRYHELMTLQGEISLEKNKEWIGCDLEVLLEGPAAGPGMTQGRSFRDAPDIDGAVLVPGRHHPGDFITVRIRNATTYDLIADEV